jgi:hypothetical protein
MPKTQVFTFLKEYAVMHEVDCFFVDRKVNVKWGFHAIRQYSLEPFRVKF